MMSQVTVKADLLQDVIGYIKESTPVLEAAQEKAAKVEAQIPQTMAILKEAGLVSAEDEAQFAQALTQDPAFALGTIEKLARGHTEPAPMGQAVPSQEKEAGLPEAKESDKVFFARAGLQVPDSVRLQGQRRTG